MPSLREAASLLGCDVRTLRRCLQHEGMMPTTCAQDARIRWLTAEQVGRVRAAMGVADLPPSMAGRIAPEVADLVRRLDALTRRVERLEAGAALDAPRTLSASNLTGQRVGEAPEDLPAGSARLGPFARAHGVAHGTATSQAQAGTIATTPRADPARADHLARWLVPDQQRAAVETWRARGQLRRECPDCPH
jgi:hypothetical protein